MRPVRPIPGNLGFTLLEALIASVILLLSVIATSMALTAGRQHSLEAQAEVQAALVADAMMSQILAEDYTTMENYDGKDEPPGSLLTAVGSAYPETYYRIGRTASVRPGSHTFSGLGVTITGLEIKVESYDDTGRILCTLQRFVPEPVS